MVKGVNKKVIEINNTGNELFEKVVLYINPQYSVLSNKELKKEAKVILKNYSIDDFEYERETIGEKRFVITIFSVIVIAAVITALCLIF